MAIGAAQKVCPRTRPGTRPRQPAGTNQPPERWWPDTLQAGLWDKLLQGTIRQREKVMRGLKSQETAQLFLDGWALHYNFFKPHEALKGKPPALAANIKTPLTDWEDIARLDVRPFSRKRAEFERDKTLQDRPLRSRQFRVPRGTL